MRNFIQDWVLPSLLVAAAWVIAAAEVCQTHAAWCRAKAACCKPACPCNDPCPCCPCGK